jgi:hypothetical protein
LDSCSATRPPLIVGLVKIGNTVVIALLTSPLHRVMSGSTAVIRYHGRKSGREISTPVQYVRDGEDVLILVGRPQSKTWWRNFESERDIDILVQGTWKTMQALARKGGVEPEAVSELLDLYLTKIPRAARSLGEGTREDQIRRAVMVKAQPSALNSGRGGSA